MRHVPLIICLVLITAMILHGVYDFFVTNEGIRYFSSEPIRLAYVVLLSVAGGMFALWISRLSPFSQRRLKLFALGALGLAGIGASFSRTGCGPAPFGSRNRTLSNSLIDALRPRRVEMSFLMGSYWHFYNDKREEERALSFQGIPPGERVQIFLWVNEWMALDNDRMRKIRNPTQRKPKSDLTCGTSAKSTHWDNEERRTGSADRIGARIEPAPPEEGVQNLRNSGFQVFASTPQPLQKEFRI